MSAHFETKRGMKVVRYGILSVLCVFFLGKILGGEGSEKSTPSSEVVSLNYMDFLKSKFKEGVDREYLICLVDSLLSNEYIDPKVVDMLNEKIQETYVDEWPTDTNPYPAHNLYKSWNTLLPHPYKNDICASDTESIFFRISLISQRGQAENLNKIIKAISFSIQNAYLYGCYCCSVSYVVTKQICCTPTTANTFVK